MSTTGTIRVAKNRDYTPISNNAMNDARLSYGARGLLAYLLCKPDHWQVKITDLINQSPAGRDQVRRLLRELGEMGYLHREKTKNDKGHWVWETTVYESPQLLEAISAAPKPSTKKPSTENPSMVNPSMEKPSTGNPSTENAAINKVMNRESNEKVNNERESSERVVSAAGISTPEKRPTALAAPSPSANSNLVLNPNPALAQDTRVLAGVCKLRFNSLIQRDFETWPRVVAAVREFLPHLSEEERGEELKVWEKLWRSGWSANNDEPTGPRSTPWLSQVLDHFPRMMSDYYAQQEFANRPEPELQPETQAQRVRRLKNEQRAGRRS